MKKIAIIEPVGEHGGMHYYDFNLAQSLANAGVDVTVYTCDITSNPIKCSFLVKKTFKKIWGNSKKIVRGIRYIFCYLYTLFDVKVNRIQIVHFHFFHYTKLECFCVVVAKLFSLKVVITTHDVESFAGPYDMICAQKILSLADKIIAHNQVIRSELLGKLQMPSDDVSIIPHGHYLNNVSNSISRLSAIGNMGLETSYPIILFFGQIKEVKGLDLLIKAIAGVKNKYPKVKLVIAGKVWKNNFEKYLQLIKENNLESHVELHIRYIHEKEVETFYRSADLIVLPYRRIYQSGVLLMAMSYGTPVVVSDLPGMTEIIEHESNGFVFKSEDAESLELIMIDALSNKKRLNEITHSALKTITTHFDWDKIGFLTKQVYREIVK